MRILNIGAGRTFIPESINIDISPEADISIDLNSDSLPFADGSIDLVFSYHCLEHIENYLFALGEIHRVLKHDGALLVGVPYVSLTEYNLVNPYHKQYFNEFSFDFFEPGKLLGSAVERETVTFRRLFYRCNYLPEYEGKSERTKEWSRRHLLNVVRSIDFGLVCVKDDEGDVDVGPQRAEELVGRFDELLGRRVSRELQLRVRGTDGDAPDPTSGPDGA